MRAAVAVAQSADDPLSCLELQDVEEPKQGPGWTRIRMHYSSLNPHDIWTLRGVGHPAERLPIILGCDAAGVTDDGREVLVHPVFGDADRGGGDVTLDPKRSLMSEELNGSLADYILVPDVNVVPKPEWLSFEHAGSLGVAWGTAYRALFTRARVKPGDRVLVQGASGGLGSAAIALASAAGAGAGAGARVYATARTERKREFALSQGAYAAFESGARLPERVDVVVETVGDATWAHSMRSLKPGGTIVVSGTTSGAMPPAELNRIFYQQLTITGATGCTKPEFDGLLKMLETIGIRPHVDTVLPFSEIKAGYQRLIDGDVMGKLVISLE